MGYATVGSPQQLAEPATIGAITVADEADPRKRVTDPLARELYERSIQARPATDADAPEDVLGHDQDFAYIVVSNEDGLVYLQNPGEELRGGRPDRIIVDADSFLRGAAPQPADGKRFFAGNLSTGQIYTVETG